MSNSYWTSFTRQPNCAGPKERWCYDNGEPFNAAKFPWRPNQPDNSGNNEKCGNFYLRPDQSSGMNDLACADTSQVVACQVNVYQLPHNSFIFSGKKTYSTNKGLYWKYTQKYT
jgi:hypothetical protein